jgi:hypothetical protein
MGKQDDMPQHDDPTELEPRPHQPPDRGPDATTAQLRRDIESGATGDKVPVLDPAASPLGTDDEAAGVPPSPDLVAVARKLERADRRAPLDPTDNTEDRYGLRLAGGLLLAVLLAVGAYLISFR